MPPRLRCTAARGLGSALNPSRLSSQSAVLLLPSTPATISASRQYATAAPGSRLSALKLPDDYVPPARPPTARPAEARKSQLLRNYTSLLRSTPLILVFQHNNLTAVEWAAVRRELRLALAKVSTPGTDSADIASKAQLQVIRGRIFDVALKIVEFHDPSKVAPTTVSSATGEKVQMVFDHDLSQAAYDTVRSITKGEMPVPESSVYAQISPLLVGPLALFTLPTVSPAHLSAALSVLSPSPPAFPAPSRKKNPSYYEPSAQSGLQKLMLVGGRVEDKVFDIDGVQWVGGIEGGLDSLRAQLVVMLQSAGLGLTTALEGASKSLWLTMESRRTVLEEEQNGGKKGESS
ncbi:54S ribosomal protein L11, mitochondrial [Madurella fahalii]|uniref:54S ribosomal protein L11, mitochondrial n=1 Tax=Madurella fahalii TaxID=1157608 RepID=A0ABQ0GMZ5_9PEZI